MIPTIVWDGKPITRPGVYTDITLDAYHSQKICDGPSVSSTNLRRVLECNRGSPAHFYSEWSGNPNSVKQEEKPHHVLGRAAHHLMLGEAAFEKHFIVRPEQWDSWRTTASREWRKQAEAAGLGVLTPDDIEAIKGMSRALGDAVAIEQTTGEVTRVCEMLAQQIERSFFWKDEMTGLWCKSRPDAIPGDSGDYVDLKTTTSTHHVDLQRSITEFGYHQQAAMIAEGSKRCAKFEMQTFTLLFVEKKNPFCVRPIVLKQDDIALGARQNRVALSLISRCIASRSWPGPGRTRDFQFMDLQQWYRDSAEEELLDIQRAADRERQRTDEFTQARRSRR